MKKRGIIMLMVCAFAAVSQLAFAQDAAITSTLKVYRISINEQGEEVATEVTTIKPGDTLEYRLTYTNNLDNNINELKAVLPVPLGLTYIEDSASPDISAASYQLNGGSFQTPPLTREVTLPNGQTEEQTVPPSQYRRLQWVITELGAGASVMLTARAKVINNG